MGLIYDLADPQELQGYVRGIQQEEEANRFTLSQFLPNDNIDDIEYRITKGSQTDQDAAVLRTWDSESPIGSRQGASRIMGELPPISKKIRLGEEERLRQRALLRGNADTTEIVNAIYNDAKNLTRSVLARIELLRGEALYAAQLTIDENGVEQTIDFGRDASMEVTPGTVWSTTATATPVQDVNTWTQAYLDRNGVRPALALTSQAVISNLLLNDEIRTLAASISGTPSIVSEQTLQTVFAAWGLPPFVKYDTLVRVAGSQVRPIPNDRVIFLPPSNEPLGSTFFGVTAEALELVGAAQVASDQAAGLVSVVEKTYDPVATWTKVAGISLPVLANPDLAMMADVQ